MRYRASGTWQHYQIFTVRNMVLWMCSLLRCRHTTLGTGLLLPVPEMPSASRYGMKLKLACTLEIIVFHKYRDAPVRARGLRMLRRARSGDF